MNEKRIGVGVGVFVFRPDGKFLMIKREGSHGAGSWSVPGGSMEYGETPEQASVREVLEETGLDIDGVTVLTHTNDVFSEADKHFLTLWVGAYTRTSEACIQEPNKCSEMIWVDSASLVLPEPLFQPCWGNLARQLSGSTVVGDDLRGAVIAAEVKRMKEKKEE